MHLLQKIEIKAFIGIGPCKGLTGDGNVNKLT